jgi:predicted deacylase
VEKSKRMAYAFNFPLVRGHEMKKFPGPASLVGYAGMSGIPGIIGGVGGAGFEDEKEQEWLEANVEGVVNVMRSLGMVDEPVRQKRVMDFKKMIRVNPKVGGFLYPERHDEHFGREVAEGEVLAKVVSPYNSEVLETLQAPCDGYLMYYPRWYPVRPGDWAYGIIQKGHPDTVWVEEDGTRTQA